jgi:hypothetical protein
MHASVVRALRRLVPRAARAPRAPLVATAAVAALAALPACAPRAARAPRPTGAAARLTTGDAVLRAMRERYDGRWYRTLTFTQRTVQVPPGGGAERRGTRHAAMSIPGRMRLETDSTGRNGQLFARDSQYVILNNQLRRGAAGHNVLQVLGFDVHAQPPARTAEQLRGLGFPTGGAVREDTWQGRPVYVVGGRGAGDLHSHQFWVDRERLVVVRLLQPLPGDTAKTYEVRFNKHRRLGDGWMATEVEALADGRRTLFEEYSDVRVDPRLSDALFDPRRWGEGSVRRDR